MSTWLIPLNELSCEQREAVELNSREHWIIGGAPGSGKTQILLHRARHLLDAGAGNAARLRIFVFTNVLVEYIRSSLRLLNLPEGCVSTFDFWTREYYKQHVSPKIPWDAEKKTYDWAAIRTGVWEEVSSQGDRPKLYDSVLVDEGQDLDPVSFDILNAITRHLTVCIDHKQQIYDHGSSEAEILRRLGLRKRNFTLLSAFRCSPYIVALASCFIQEVDQRTAFIRQNRVPMTEKETPLLYVAEDIADERLRIIEVVKTRQAKSEKIAILLPENRQVFGLANTLTEAGIQVEIRMESWRKNVKYPPLNFASELPKLITYHSAKGLTFDSVILPRVVSNSFRSNLFPPTNLLFVGTTRATRWVFLSTLRDQNALDMNLMRGLEVAGKLTVQTRSDRIQASTASKPGVPLPGVSANEEGIGDLL